MNLILLKCNEDPVPNKIILAEEIFDEGPGYIRYINTRGVLATETETNYDTYEIIDLKASKLDCYVSITRHYTERLRDMEL